MPWSDEARKTSSYAWIIGNLHQQIIPITDVIVIKHREHCFTFSYIFVRVKIWFGLPRPEPSHWHKDSLVIKHIPSLTSVALLSWMKWQNSILSLKNLRIILLLKLCNCKFFQLLQLHLKNEFLINIASFTVLLHCQMRLTALHH